MGSNGPSPKSSPSAPPLSPVESESPNSTISAIKYAVFSGKAHAIFWSVTSLGFASDLLSKQWAINAIGVPPEPGQLIYSGAEKNPVVLIENYITLDTLHNSGAVAGFLSGKTGLLIGASVLAILFLFWLFTTSRSNQWVTHIALGLLFSGALGNLYDRIFNDGRVIDFIEVDLHFWVFNPWPTFNLADVWLCIGVVVLMLTFLKGQHPIAAAKDS